MSSEEENQLYCRTCSTSTNSVIPIFAENDVSRNIRIIIEKHLPIRVSKEDILPLHVCNNCAHTLSEWNILVDGVLKAEEKLTEIFNRVKECGVEEDGLHEASGFLSDGGTDSDNQPLITIAAPVKRKKEKSKKESSLPEETCISKSRNHNGQVCKDANERKTKDFCSLCLKSVRVLEKHLRKHEWGEELTFRFCPVCGESNAQSKLHCEHLYSHVGGLSDSSEENDKHLCKVCLKEFTSYDEVSRHVLVHISVITDATPRASVYCMVCGKAMMKATLAKHVAGHAGKRRWTCHDCGKQYAQESGLVRHLRVVHEGLRRYKCPICSLVLQSQAQLQTHQNSHTDPSPFQCDSCGRTFKSQKHLYHHRRYHHTENGLRVKCWACDRVFSSASVMRRHHKTVHLRLKEFQCEICSAQLTTKNYLLEHLRTHSDERPEVCTVCGKTFQMNGNLRQHMKTHMERVHICHVCGKRFVRRCQLVIHMGSHRGIPPLQCASCGQAFLLKIDLQKHSANCHNTLSEIH